MSNGLEREILVSNFERLADVKDSEVRNGHLIVLLQILVDGLPLGILRHKLSSNFRLFSESSKPEGNNIPIYFFALPLR
jgi:hypothetical protein